MLSRFLKVYPFLKISGGIRATLNVSTTITFILAVTAVIAFLVRGCILSTFSLNCLRAVAFVLIVTTLIRVMRVVLGGISPSLCRTLNIFLPLVAAGYYVLNITVLIVRGSCSLLAKIICTFSATLNFNLTLALFTNLHRRVDLIDMPGNVRNAPVTLVATKLLTVTFVNFSKIIGVWEEGAKGGIRKKWAGVCPPFSIFVGLFPCVYNMLVAWGLGCLCLV